MPSFQENAKGIATKMAGSPMYFVPAVFTSLLLFRLLHRADKSTPKSHKHEALDHSHDHVHVTHERTDDAKGIGGWTHLTASHHHEHNHTGVEHTHRPHQKFDEEHEREAHVHDHGHPTI